MADVAPIWQVEIKAWASWLRAAGRPPGTVTLRTYHVSRLAIAFGDRSPWDVGIDELAEWLGLQPWAPETRRASRASLRTFYSWGMTTGRTTSNPAALLPTIRLPRGLPRPAPDAVILSALGGCDERVRLMLRLGALGGLRRGEIATLRTTDLEPDTGGWVLRIVGKGGHVRHVPVDQDVVSAIHALPGGFVFPGQDDGHLSPAYVGKLISRCLPESWTAHTLRHRFATVAYAAERDIFAVQKLLGHAKPETTQRYTRIPDASLRAAVAAAGRLVA